MLPRPQFSRLRVRNLDSETETAPHQTNTANYLTIKILVNVFQSYHQTKESPKTPFSFLDLLPKQLYSLLYYCILWSDVLVCYFSIAMYCDSLITITGALIY